MNGNSSRMEDGLKADDGRKCYGKRIAKEEITFTQKA